MAIDEEQNRLAHYFDGLNIERNRPRRGETPIIQEHRLRGILDLVLHATDCCLPDCQYRSCPKAKGLLYHGFTCETRASGGCDLCKKMWCLLQLHARACQESNCRVPRCRGMKVYQQQQQSDSGGGATGNS